MQRKVGQQLPYGWAQGPDGKETTDPVVVSGYYSFFLQFFFNKLLVSHNRPGLNMFKPNLLG